LNSASSRRDAGSPFERRTSAGKDQPNLLFTDSRSLRGALT
jgi:hypothetical protein